VENEEILRIANEIAGKHGLKAEFLEGIQSVGVGGDERSYTPVICLVGPFPGHEILAKISSEISNHIPVNRVTFELASKK
jgi:GMP synthase PP-ATPase subunit